MRPPLTTHVLDVQNGVPAAGVEVRLFAESDPATAAPLASGVTNADGRIDDWLEGIGLVPGVYRLEFDTGPYFAAQGVEAFHPGVVVRFSYRDDGRHHHVPVLVSAFGYTTYRGS